MWVHKWSAFVSTIIFPSSYPMTFCTLYTFSIILMNSDRFSSLPVWPRRLGRAEECEPCFTLYHVNQDRTCIECTLHSRMCLRTVQPSPIDQVFLGSISRNDVWKGKEITTGSKQRLGGILVRRTIPLDLFWQYFWALLPAIRYLWQKVNSPTVLTASTVQVCTFYLPALKTTVPRKSLSIMFRE